MTEMKTSWISYAFWLFVIVLLTKMKGCLILKMEQLKEKYSLEQVQTIFAEILPCFYCN